MLRIMHVDEISDLLLRLPSVVRMQEMRSAGFGPAVMNWLAALEKAFTASRLYQAGSIAALRSELLAAMQGQIPNSIEFRGRPTRSRILNAVASRSLQHAADVASNLIAENRSRIVDAERVAQQIVAAAMPRKLMALRDQGMTNTEYLQQFRRSLRSIPDLENISIHLEGLVGPYDALILLDRALGPYQEMMPVPVGLWMVPSPTK